MKHTTVFEDRAIATLDDIRSILERLDDEITDGQKRINELEEEVLELKQQIASKE